VQTQKRNCRNGGTDVKSQRSKEGRVAEHLDVLASISGILWDFLGVSDQYTWGGVILRRPWTCLKNLSFPAFVWSPVPAAQGSGR